MDIIYPPDTTTLIGLATGWGTAMRMTCTVEPIAESGKMVRTWNGTLLNLAPANLRQMRITLASEDDMLPAPLMGLFPGDELSITPPCLFGGTLPGRASTGTQTYDRMGVRGGDVPPFRTFRRYTFNVALVEPWTQSYLENEKRYAWQAVFEERRYPL